MNDLTIREKMVSALLVIAILWLGLFPKPVLNTAKPAILKTLNNQKEISLQNQRGKTFDRYYTILLPFPTFPRGKEFRFPGRKIETKSRKLIVLILNN